MAGVRIGDGVDVEEHGAGDVAGEIAVAAVASLPDQGQGCVHDAHAWIAQAPGEPGRGDERIYSSHDGTGRPFSRRNGGLKIFDW